MTKSNGKRSLSSDTLRSQLREAGLRATATRVAVLAALHDTSEAATHAELALRLAPEGVDRTSVFRALTDFAGRKIVNRMDYGDHVWRYALQQQHDRARGRAFFVCEVTGERTQLPASAVVVNAGRGSPRTLKSGEYIVLVRGVCDDCARVRD